MSFILDALKKAESERSRQLGPVLMDARVAPPRRGLPAWALALGIALAVNLVVLAWLLLRPPPSTPAQEPVAVASAAAADAQPPTATSSPPLAGLGAPASGAQPTVVPPVAAPPVAAARAGLPSLSSDVDALPTAQELQAQGVALPDLQLNLHIYDPAPEHRSILLNGQRLREGEYTSNGVRVERITEHDVALEAAGRRFRIQAGG
jgi:hypothetical protein